MRIGLLTDIHEAVEHAAAEQTQHLRMAFSLFRKEYVEQVVVIGDVSEMATGRFPTRR